MPLIIEVSDTFRCAECNSKLLKVRKKATDFGHNLWCPRCDADLLEKAEERAEQEDRRGKN